MSETETGNMLPPQDVFVAAPDGLSAWRPAFARIIVEPLPNGGKQLTVTEYGGAVYSRILSQADAAHLVALLSA